MLTILNTIKYLNIFFSDDDQQEIHPTETNSSSVNLSAHSPMIFQNRFQNPSQSSPSAPLLPSNLLNPIAQPYSADICNYGPVYHSHNILHNYNTVYTNEKNIRSSNFNRAMYSNYGGLYASNSNFRGHGLHQNGYDFAPR